MTELDDLEVQLRFWRQAAEHAIEGWNKLEDKYDALIEMIGGMLEEWPDLPISMWHDFECIYTNALHGDLPFDLSDVK